MSVCSRTGPCLCLCGPLSGLEIKFALPCRGGGIQGSEITEISELSRSLIFPSTKGSATSHTQLHSSFTDRGTKLESDREVTGSPAIHKTSHRHYKACRPSKLTHVVSCLGSLSIKPNFSQGQGRLKTLPTPNAVRYHVRQLQRNPYHPHRPHTWDHCPESKVEPPQS